MQTSTGRSLRVAGFVDLVLPAATIPLGMQILRVFFPSLAWYLKDTVGVGSITLAGYAFAAFLAGFLAALIRRLTGPRVALWVAVAGLAGVRIVEQVVREPALDLWLSLAGSALFVIFLPIWAGQLRATSGEAAAPRWAFGLLLGLAIDSAIKGAAGTLDLSWIEGAIPLLVVFLLAGLAIWGLWREPAASREALSEASWGDALALLALGPYLMIQALVYQNPGWIAEVAGLDAPAAFLVLMLGNLVATVGAAWGFGGGRAYRLWLGPIGALFLVLVSIGAARHGLAFALALCLTQLLLGWGWAVLGTASMRGAGKGLGRTTLFLALGMLLFLLLSFLYYVSLDIAVPVPRTALIPAGAVIVGLLLVFGVARTRRAVWSSQVSAPGLIVATGLLLIPILAWPGLRTLAVVDPDPETPIRVMTYNIHSAFDTQGRQDPEAIARVIEASGAQIVALQEVSRGWLIDGATDLVTWLARRLHMLVVFRGTADTVWGNAILTQMPIVESGWSDLPLAGTLLPRGYLWAEIEIGAEAPLLVIATHLHHVESEHEPRLVQVPVLLEFWDGRPLSVLLGDLNSEPHYPEMGLIAQAGWIDSWAEAGAGDGFTWPAFDPFERIDWIWHTPDLTVREAETIPTTASDHIPVQVLLEVSP